VPRSEMSRGAVLLRRGYQPVGTVVSSVAATEMPLVWSG
jgi:hypothetical protein